MNMKEIIEQPREYYKADGLLRYNPLWAFVLGERSVGKSFEFKRRSITTPDSIWVYLRRTDVLRKDPKNWKSYLSDLMQKEVVDLDREYKVNSEGIWVDGIQKVIFSALSTDASAHSMNYLPDSMQEQVTFEGQEEGRRKDKKKKKEELPLEHYEKEAERIDDAVESVKEEVRKPIEIKKKIVFEEILEPKNKYLKNEVEQLFEFYVTVDRYTNTQLFGIANLMTTYNPYFEYFGIRPFKEEFRWFKDKTLLVQNVKLAAMEDFVKQQRFYNLVRGTDYGEYLTNNTPWQDDLYAIETRPKDSVCKYNIHYAGKYYGVWEKDGMYYISEKYNKQLPTFSGLKSMEEWESPIKKGEVVHRMLNTGIESNYIRFDSIAIREMCFDLINGGFREN